MVVCLATLSAALAAAPRTTVVVEGASAPVVVVSSPQFQPTPGTGMVHFAQTLYLFPGGELFANVQSCCDVCEPHHAWQGRSFFSADNGTTWSEIPQPTAAAMVFKNCIAGTAANVLTCFAYPLAIDAAAGNRTGKLLMARFEVGAGGSVRQTLVQNATMHGWPAPGLTPFPPRTAVGFYYMVQDGSPVASGDAWLLPMYGGYENADGKVVPGLALLRSDSAALDSWSFYSWVNNGTHCNTTDPRSGGRCSPTENALIRLSDGRLLSVWRNDPGTNLTLMAQVSSDEGRTFSVATPLNGKPVTTGAYPLTPGPFGVEPKLAYTESGVLLLQTGRPRIYLWALPLGADPLRANWQSFDLGVIHNASVPKAPLPGSDVPLWPADYWTLPRASCCTTSYTGLVALPGSDEVVVTYDMIARMYQHKGADLIVSQRLRVGLTPPSPFMLAVDSSATSAEQHAAERLAHWLGRAARPGNGAPPPVVPAAQCKAAGASGTALCIGVGPGAAIALGLPAASLGGLGTDGVLASSRAAGLTKGCAVASGSPRAARGTIYAAFRLLEALGYRFWAPDATQVPRAAEASAAFRAGFDVTFRPKLEWRQAETYSTNGADPERKTGSRARQLLNARWIEAARDNGCYGAAYDEPGGCFAQYATPPGSAHTSYTILGGQPGDKAPLGPVLELFKSHNEWFWPRDDPTAYGQLCWTNASLLEFVVGQARRFLRAQPTANLISISQNDNLLYCNDSAEAAVIAAEGTPGGPLLRAVNHIADALAAEFPHVQVHTLAYSYSKPVPKVTRPRRNVVMQVAAAAGDPLLAAWGKVASQIFLWAYFADFHNFVMPYPNYRSLGADIQWFARSGVTGGYFEGNGWTIAGELDALKAYLVESLLWDPEQDPEQLISAFLDGYYGPAAAAVRSYMNVFETSLAATNDTLHLHNDWHSPYLSPEALIAGARSLNVAEATAERTTPSEPWLSRVRLAKLAIYYPMLLRWAELVAYARKAALAWPLEPTKRAALDFFVATCAQHNMSNGSLLAEPDINYPDHNLSWFVALVNG